MYKYLFGPVPSRRLGMSLGVDLVKKKTCSLDCIYCESGRTTNLTTEKKEYINSVEIKKELINYFDNNLNPDYITFSGFGEPTLNLKIKNILDFIKQNRPNIPVAVLTNGTMLFDDDVKDALKNADLVVPSLDAASQDIFEKINRPAKGLTIDKHIKGIIDFRRVFKKKLYIEIFIIPKINDDEDELLKLKDIIKKIEPDLIQLNSLDRPGTVTELQKANENDLQKVIDVLGFNNIKIISSPNKKSNIQNYRKDIKEAIIETILRRPCTSLDLEQVLGLPKNEVDKCLNVLMRENKIISKKEKRGLFYLCNKS